MKDLDLTNYGVGDSRSNILKLNEKAKQMVTEWIIRDKVTLIALGTGTASRESEKVMLLLKGRTGGGGTIFDRMSIRRVSEKEIRD